MDPLAPVIKPELLEELRAAGFDVKAERAAVEALLADLEQPAASIEFEN